MNIALHYAIPSGDPRVAVMNCPGSTRSDLPHSAVTAILPDWVVIQGSYTSHDDELPDLQDFVDDGDIIAVGDTKLFQEQPNSKTTEDESENHKTIVEGTHSCHPNWLAQVQHYAHTLGTRFGFVITNKELVLAQFLGEEETSPRLQRGLRSSTLPEHLGRGLPSDFETSDTRAADERGGHGEKPPRTPQPKQKRRHESGDSATLARSQPPDTRNLVGREDTRVPSSPPVGLPPAYDVPWSSPVSVLEARGRRSRAKHPSPTPSELPPSSPHQTTSPEQQPPSSGSVFLPSGRDIEIGRTLIRSFRIPNSCDEDSADNSDGEEDRVHPAKALFALLLHAYSVGNQGREITSAEAES